MQSLKEKNQCSRSELRFTISSVTGTPYLSSHHSTMRPVHLIRQIGRKHLTVIDPRGHKFLYTMHSPRIMSSRRWLDFKVCGGKKPSPPPHHFSPNLHGNESEALKTAPVDLTNAFQLVNTRQDHSLYLPVSSWMVHLWKGQQEAVQTMRNDFELLIHKNLLTNKRLKIQYRPVWNAEYGVREMVWGLSFWAVKPYVHRLGRARAISRIPETMLSFQ